MNKTKTTALAMGMATAWGATAVEGAVVAETVNYEVSATLNADRELQNAVLVIWSFAYDGVRNYSTEFIPVGNVSPGDMFTASGQLDVIFPAPGDDQGRGESVHVALLATYPTSADGVTIGSDPNFICSNEGRSFQRVMWRGNSAAEIQQQAFHDELVDGDLAYLDRVIFDDYESSNDFSRVSGLPLDMADIISGDPVNLNYDLALGSFSDLTASGTGSAFLQLTPVPEPASLGALGGLLVLSLRRRRGDAVGR